MKIPNWNRNQVIGTDSVATDTELDAKRNWQNWKLVDPLRQQHRIDAKLKSYQNWNRWETEMKPNWNWDNNWTRTGIGTKTELKPELKPVQNRIEVGTGTGQKLVR